MDRNLDRKAQEEGRETPRKTDYHSSPYVRVCRVEHHLGEVMAQYVYQNSLLFIDSNLLEGSLVDKLPFPLFLHLSRLELDTGGPVRQIG